MHKIPVHDTHPFEEKVPSTIHLEMFGSCAEHMLHFGVNALDNITASLIHS